MEAKLFLIQVSSGCYLITEINEVKTKMEITMASYLHFMAVGVPELN